MIRANLADSTQWSTQAVGRAAPKTSHAIQSGISERARRASDNGFDQYSFLKSQAVRTTLGIPPVTQWHTAGSSTLSVDTYLFAVRHELTLPKLAMPMLFIQLDGRKVAFHRRGSNITHYVLPNRSVLIPAGVETIWESGPGSTTIASINLDDDDDNPLPRLLGDTEEPLVLSDALLPALVRQMLRIPQDNRPGERDCDQNLAECFLSHLNWLANGPIEESLARNTSSDWAISETLVLIDRHLEEALTIESLASSVNMSPPLFRRRFTAATGMSVHHYVMKIRIQRANELLASTNVPLASIAVQCGFSSQSHMTKVFRREIGATPGDVRRNLNRGDPKTHRKH